VNVPLIFSSIHEKRKDFECGFCEKSFAHRYTLREHICAKHTLQHCHSCRLCGKGFAHKTNCGRHLRTVHRDELAARKYETDADMLRELIENKPMEANVLQHLLAQKYDRAETMVAKEEDQDETEEEEEEEVLDDEYEIPDVKSERD
jgi:hypothetical protein